MNITTIRGLESHLNNYSGFTDDTIRNVIEALGFDPVHATSEEVKELSTQFENCAEHGANIGITGFIYYSETIPFYMANRQDIVKHMEQTAAEMGTDIISMVQCFGIFRHGGKPAPSEVCRALWDSNKHQELTTIYNVFAWYALEEIARTWYRYLEDNPAAKAALAA
jgi:hypothetical protein